MSKTLQFAFSKHVHQHQLGQEIEAWLPPGFRCSAMPHQDSWCVNYNSKRLAKRSFKKYGGEDGAVKELVQHAWLHAQSMDPSLSCPHRSLFEKTTAAPATTCPAGISSSSSSSKATAAAIGGSSSSSGSSGSAPKSSEFSALAAGAGSRASSSGAGSRASSSQAQPDNVVLADLVREGVVGSVSKKRKTSCSKSTT